ncbi:hypothetical protein VCHA56P521_20132 [Vibrio chagasii]|nr:hypothetical protein VCHA27O13_20222 [Vibrio chagasii]CAH6795210.1 hypothetical protein VCHA34P131_100077 [Vibrio chagasii]CAH6799178.1 hypothetical protein VCHA34P121_100109 [Vibrio chagasii]CAH6868064.1 hypothetical protein VCHA34O109_200077 [Vibrio chagasii]CAH6882467.1 hypothetical protein VCHA34P116_20024 [Vibrio chagasii]
MEQHYKMDFGPPALCESALHQYLTIDYNSLSKVQLKRHS